MRRRLSWPANARHLPRTPRCGTSGRVSFEFRHTTPAAANAFVDALTLFGIGASWGGYESLALAAQPERLREHRQWSGDAPVVRLHIGLEDPQDLIADLAQAFAVATPAL